MAKPAAPVYLREPAITNALPKVPLKESSGRGGISDAANSGVIGVAEGFSMISNFTSEREID